MNISCKRCGHIIATRSDTTITVNGQTVPTDQLEGVIIRCAACGRTKTYYLKTAQKPVETGFLEGMPDILSF